MSRELINRARSRGRPPIGPRIQARVRIDIASYVRREARQRGVTDADIVREIVEAGYTALTTSVERIRD